MNNYTFAHKGGDGMGNQRKKSAATIQKNLEKTKQKMLEMEAELEAAKEARYNTIARCFMNAFDDCVDFDLINMSDSKLQSFMHKLRRYYDSQIYWNSVREIPVLDDGENNNEALDEEPMLHQMILSRL